MNKTLRFRVYNIALEVRKWAEKRAGDVVLCGYCAVASAELFRRLAAAGGIQSSLHIAYMDWGAHVYLVVDDHIVDVTATQFGHQQEIVIRHIKEAEVEEWWQSGDIFECVKEFRKHQIRTGWPKEQVCRA